MELVAGIDVGGTRTGSHVAVIDLRGRLVEPVLTVASPAAGIRHLLASGATTVVIDAPRHPAPDGAHVRACERELRRLTDRGTFGTPDAAHVASHYLHDWLECGFAWFAAAEDAGLTAIEGIPIVAFASLEQRHIGESRIAFTARVTRTIRARLGCPPFEVREQHERDALCAAWIARACLQGHGRFAGPFDGDRIAWVDTVRSMDPISFASKGHIL